MFRESDIFAEFDMFRESDIFAGSDAFSEFDMFHVYMFRYVWVQEGSSLERTVGALLQHS